ncbi:DUF2840 domain-containing protein [Paremcibacter congregatus]|uniref:DUF2840 domain-containing protein n=1 Tax=Paremcibacter congregatus TaxID=2043170 RepID=UPI0030ECC535|tara:strand:- start:6302 stop:6769 length:468 start_codon:yes stop_codon:yes gene_type:complete
MTDYLTRVHLHFGRDSFNYYIRFGIPKYRDDYTGREAYEYYSCGDIFGYIRWETNEYGTKIWRFFVLQGGDPTTAVCNIPGITPGAEVLLDVSGKARVHRLFEAIDLIEQAEIDLADVAPWYWIQTNARLNASLDPLPYEARLHNAWLLERAVSA